jgi:hypothetical protein
LLAVGGEARSLWAPSCSVIFRDPLES